MIRPRHLAPVVTSALLAGVILSLVGCAPEPSSSAGPAPFRSAIPTPSRTTSPAGAARIQVRGAELVIMGSDGSELQRLPYVSDPVVAVAVLTRAIGETPAAETLVATTCSLTQKRLSWGDALSLSYTTEDAADTVKRFTVRSDSADTAGGIAVETTQGFSVGDPVSSLIASAPGAITQGENDPSAFGIRVFYDLDATQNGALADSDPKTGLISIIYAPANVNQDC